MTGRHYDPKKHRRRSIRLREYDYTQPGAYFVTICTHNRECLFNDAALADAVRMAWEWLPRRFKGIRLDEFVIMPNHVHFIVWIEPGGAYRHYAHANGVDHGRGGQPPAPTENTPKRVSLPDIVGAFKTVAAQHINRLRGTPGTPVWQRNYYERVIRNERELNAVREYIHNNPVNWDRDIENPMRMG